jgi:hypothetical protein
MVAYWLAPQNSLSLSLWFKLERIDLSPTCSTSSDRRASFPMRYSHVVLRRRLTTQSDGGARKPRKTRASPPRGSYKQVRFESAVRDHLRYLGGIDPALHRVVRVPGSGVAPSHSEMRPSVPWRDGYFGPPQQCLLSYPRSKLVSLCRLEYIKACIIRLSLLRALLRAT